MKKLFFLALCAIVAMSTMAQSTKVMKVWSNGNVVEQKDTRAVDSVTFAVSDDKLVYIEDVFTLSGRGDVPTFDSVYGGVFHVGDIVRIISPCDSIPVVTDTIKGIQGPGRQTYESTELFPDTSSAGAFLFATGRVKGIVESGAAVVAVENSPYEKAHKLICDAYVYTKDEGGRHTPFFVNYRPQLYTNKVALFTVDVTDLGTVDGEAVEMVMPGSTVENMVIESYRTTVNGWGYGFVPYIGQTLYVRESSRTVAILTVKGWE